MSRDERLLAAYARQRAAHERALQEAQQQAEERELVARREEVIAELAILWRGERNALPVDPRVRLAIVQWPPDAPRGAVTTFCVEHGISRETFYAIRKRAAADGPAAALEPRSRRPKVSPTRLTDDAARQADRSCRAATTLSL